MTPNFRADAMFVIVVQRVFHQVCRYDHDISAYQFSLAKTQSYSSCLRHTFAMSLYVTNHKNQMRDFKIIYKNQNL
jgi:hypothetical protein